ncbi:hypothetical protein [Adhaeretor mobilis]|uniref:hypothetical protein n=1 Tax=Adhaeretor mobilis TaxID=1930276 RepID=UPI001C54EFD3|nr:hypothetical protein [Adhaeretor mobilis]
MTNWSTLIKSGQLPCVVRRRTASHALGKASSGTVLSLVSTLGCVLLTTGH